MENADGDVLWITTFGDSMDFEITQEDDYYAKGAQRLRTKRFIC